MDRNRGNMRWQEIYRKWSAEHQDLSPKQRGNVVRGCLRKLAHPNILSAFAHASTLPLQNRKLPTVYLCEICGAFHVGNRKSSNRQAHRLGFLGDNRSPSFDKSTRGGEMPYAVELARERIDGETH